MDFRLVNPDAPGVYCIGDARILYHEALPSERDAISEKHTDRLPDGTGKCNIAAVAHELINWKVYGWENVNHDGLEVPFSKATLARIDWKANLYLLSNAICGIQPEPQKPEPETPPAEEAPKPLDP
jgi:hypothetical protein